MGYTIERVRLGDEEALAYIQTESWKAAFKDILSADILQKCTQIDKVTAMYRRLLEQNIGNGYLLKVEGIPHCIAWWDATRENDMPGYAELICIHSLQNQWRKGYGSKMMDTVLDEIANAGYSKVMLWVFEDNVRARRFYEAHGFETKGKQKPNLEPTEICYEKKLESIVSNNKLPTRQQAEALLQEAEACNPGPWGNHSRITAACAEKIAALCEGMDAEKAYILGLLHDIGRKFGVKHLGHVYDGYMYMLELGYEEVARICLTHSFSVPDISCYIGNFDITEEQQKLINDALHTCEYDDYDRLIQLCDCLAGAEGVMNMEERMADVKRRYGNYPQDKWDMNMYLKALFEEKAGKDIYEIVG